MTSEQDRIPSITKTAFACPHCGAYTTQTWYKVYCDKYSEKVRTPSLPDPNKREEFFRDSDASPEVKKMILEWVDRMSLGKPFLQNHESGEYLYNSGY